MTRLADLIKLPEKKELTSGVFWRHWQRVEVETEMYTHNKLIDLIGNIEVSDKDILSILEFDVEKVEELIWKLMPKVKMEMDLDNPNNICVRETSKKGCKYLAQSLANNIDKIVRVV